MKFKQIKEFNKDTITPEIAAKICSLVAWNHLKEDRFKDTFTIENNPPKGVLKTGGGGIFPWDEKKSDIYNKVETGVEIDIKATNQRVIIFESGRAMCYYKNSKDLVFSRYEYIIRNVETGEERVEDQLNYPASPVDLMQLYLDLGFYTITDFKIS